MTVRNPNEPEILVGYEPSDNRKIETQLIKVNGTLLRWHGSRDSDWCGYKPARRAAENVVFEEPRSRLSYLNTAISIIGNSDFVGDIAAQFESPQALREERSALWREEN